MLKEPPSLADFFRRAVAGAVSDDRAGLWLSVGAECQHREDRGSELPRNGYLQRTPVYASLDGFPNSASLRIMGYLPGFVGSIGPGFAIITMVFAGAESCLARKLGTSEADRERLVN